MQEPLTRLNYNNAIHCVTKSFVQNIPRIGVIAGAIRNYYSADDKLFH